MSMSGLTIRNRKQGLIFQNFNNLDDFFFFFWGGTQFPPPLTKRLSKFKYGKNIIIIITHYSEMFLFFLDFKKLLIDSHKQKSSFAKIICGP